MPLKGNKALENDKFVTSTLTLDQAEKKLASLDVQPLEDTISKTFILSTS